MGASLNLWQLIGNLGADPETRYTGNGTAITEIRVATSEQWTDKQSGEKQERTEWTRVVFFGRLAEVAGEYLHKGSKVYVSGRSRTDEYTDKDGVKHYPTKMHADEMKMLDGKPEGGKQQRTNTTGSQQRQQTQQRQRQEQPPAHQSDFDQDDIPF